MKNLATCKPSEFIAQTAKIRDAVADWLDAIDFQRIRNRAPVYEVAPADATAEQRAEVIRHNGEILKKQAAKNMGDILGNALTKYPQKTLEVLALCCFVEPDHVDDYNIDEYMDCIMDMAESKAVIRFFSLLARLDQTSTSRA